MKSVVGCLICFLLCAAMASAQYVAVDVTPAGMSGTLAAASGTTQGGVAYAPAFTSGHALVLDSTGAVDVNPFNWFSSQVLGASSGQEVGFGLPVPSVDITAGTHALLWFGTGTVIDLSLPKWGSTLATCTNGVNQGGYGYPPKGKGKVKPNPHALIWSGSAATAVDMNPVKTVESRIFGCADTTQVGYTMKTATSFTHAAMWSGSAASVVDLNPAGFLSSTVFGAAGTQQAGSGIPNGSNRHALLWNGSAASVVDLHPAGYSASLLYATNGTQQAGEATDNGAPQRKHAMAWSGTPASAVDLNQFLPAGLTDASARAIDASGNIVGFASQLGQPTRMIMWVKVQ